MATIKTAAKQLGAILAIVGSLMFCFDVGISETWNVITGDTLDASTTAVFGGAPDLVDRATVFLMAATVAGGLGLIGVSRQNPKMFNQILTYAPWLGLAIGLTTYSSSIVDVISGEFDFSTVSDAYGGMILAATGWVMAGVSNLLNNR